jgi:hypothetical protein
MSQGMTEKEGPTIWAAEHGASTPDIGKDDDASNAGHRWRIHGRLQDRLEEEGGPPAADQLAGPSPAALPSILPTIDEESLRSLVARETEVDLRDLQIQVSRGEVTLRGTVAHRGEIRGLLELLRRQPGVTAVHDRLRAQVD